MTKTQFFPNILFEHRKRPVKDSFDSKKYEKWSDERFHALLVRAESIIYKTAVTVLSSGTDIFAIAAGCLNIRDSYKVLEKVHYFYRNCT